MNRSTPRTKPWRSAKYALTPSVYTGSPRTGASGASGERSAGAMERSKNLWGKERAKRGSQKYFDIL